MTNVELDDMTAKALADAAQAQNMSVAEFVRARLLGHNRNGSSNEVTADSFDSELDSLLFSGPSLPTDFSRSDICSDHDNHYI
jgi:hypothetical protein